MAEAMNTPMTMMTKDKRPEWKSESYDEATDNWPRRGRHILAQYDDDSIVVYQAFKPSIAEYAVKHQRFGGPDFSFARMSWIKTNFLWMMYRCGWARKRNQECVLAVRITRQGFEEILSQAYSAGLQKARKIQSIQVRLQWDPDHLPSGNNLPRKAIQLGLKEQILQKYATEWIVQIEDITAFVKQQHEFLQTNKNCEKGLMVALERVYPVEKFDISTRLALDYYEHDEQPKDHHTGKHHHQADDEDTNATDFQNLNKCTDEDLKLMKDDMLQGHVLANDATNDYDENEKNSDLVML